jgi:Rha family phage regulatory protein
MNAIVDFRSLVDVGHGVPMTTSLRVADVFGKLHKNVIRAIESLDCSAEFASLNFELCYQNNDLQNGKPQPYYKMTKNGFVFLVMGFTGRQAAKFKEDYINAFDQMSDALMQLGMGKMQRYNFLSLKYTRELMAVSLGAKAMRAWQETKPELATEINALEREIQPMLGIFEELNDE